MLSVVELSSLLSCCCCCRDVWTICWSQVVEIPIVRLVFRYANIILLSHLLNYVLRIDAFLAT